MNNTKQIATRISHLLDSITSLLENHLDIRRELLRIQAQLNSPDILEDINGIRVYKGSDYVDTTIEAEGKIVIGEELDKSEVFPDVKSGSVKSGSDEPLDEPLEVEGWNRSFEPVMKIEIPNRYVDFIDATFTCKQ